MQHTDLAHCVNPRHLQQEEMSKAYADFVNSPINLLRLTDFFTSEFVSSCSTFLNTQAVYGDTYGVFGQKLPTVDKDTWLSSSESDRFFHYQMLESSGADKFNSGALTFLKLRKLLQSEAFRNYINKLTGRALTATSAPTVHKMHAGHFLKRHNDRISNRQIAIIFYLSPDWLSEYGGQLHIFDKGDKEFVVNPIYNSLTLFDVNKHDYHYISKILESALPQPNSRNGRISINAWFQ